MAADLREALEQVRECLVNGNRTWDALAVIEAALVSKPAIAGQVVVVHYRPDQAVRRPGENRAGFRSRMRLEKRRMNGWPRSWGW